MRRMLRVLGILLLCATPVAFARAQGATAPETLLAAPGFPQLLIRASESALELPASIPAARTLVRFENATDRSLHPLLFRLPEEISTERALADFAGDASEPPAWLMDAHFPGFVGETMPGAVSWAVIDIVAGNYLLIGSTVVTFEVSGVRSIPPAQQTPAADVNVDLFEFGFGFPRDIPEGPQVWGVTNAGDLPHEILLVWTPDIMSPEDMLAALMPARGASLPEGLTPPITIGGMGWLSPGATAWTEVDLPPGSYLALCFVYDPDIRSTHLEREMVGSFTIGIDGTPEAIATPVS